MFFRKSKTSVTLENKNFISLISFLKKVPSIGEHVAFGSEFKGMWWVKFQIDIEHKCAWYVVQELGSIVNYLSLEERLPTVFYPVSPAPYLNGGPDQYLSWVIENKDSDFTPNALLEWLKARMPNPVDDINEWVLED